VIKALVLMGLIKEGDLNQEIIEMNGV